MNGPVGPVGLGHAHGKAASHRRKGASHEAKAAEALTGKLYTFTLNADTAQLVKLELQDEHGTRRELSPDEKTKILGAGGESALEALLARAFEAGIQIALEDTLAELDDDEGEESDAPEEDALRRLLLKRLIERSSIKGLLDREVLTRAMLATLIQQAMNSPAADAGKTTGAPADRTAHARTDRH